MLTNFKPPIEKPVHGIRDKVSPISCADWLHLGFVAYGFYTLSMQMHAIVLRFFICGFSIDNSFIEPQC